MKVIYEENKDVAIFNNYRFRRDKKTGYYLSSKKIGDKRKRLHVYVWEYFNGELPKGYNIHHIDGDKSNNDISNLKLLSSSKHNSLHTRENCENNYDRVIANLNNNALPAAIKWHKSNEGRVWHKKHYEECKDKFIKEYEFNCLNCNKEFKSTNINSKFCSNNCKSSYRRKLGVDNVTKICVKCGEEYKANKYSKTKYCKKCKSKRS